jgi:hypothetical protein
MSHIPQDALFGAADPTPAPVAPRATQGALFEARPITPAPRGARNPGDRPDLHTSTLPAASDTTAPRRPIVLVAPAAGVPGGPRRAELWDEHASDTTVKVVYCDSRTSAHIARTRILGPAPTTPSTAPAVEPAPAAPAAEPVTVDAALTEPTGTMKRVIREAVERGTFLVATTSTAMVRRMIAAGWATMVDAPDNAGVRVPMATVDGIKAAGADWIRDAESGGYHHLFTGIEILPGFMGDYWIASEARGPQHGRGPLAQRKTLAGTKEHALRELARVIAADFDAAIIEDRLRVGVRAGEQGRVLDVEQAWEAALTEETFRAPANPAVIRMQEIHQAAREELTKRPGLVEPITGARVVAPSSIRAIGYMTPDVDPVRLSDDQRDLLVRSPKVPEQVPVVAVLVGVTGHAVAVGVFGCAADARSWWRRRGNETMVKTFDFVLRELPGPATADSAEPTRNNYRDHGEPTIAVYFGRDRQPKLRGRTVNLSRVGMAVRIVDAATKATIEQPGHGAKLWLAPLPSPAPPAGPGQPVSGRVDIRAAMLDAVGAAIASTDARVPADTHPHVLGALEDAGWILPTRMVTNHGLGRFTDERGDAAARQAARSGRRHTDDPISAGDRVTHPTTPGRMWVVDHVTTASDPRAIVYDADNPADTCRFMARNLTRADVTTGERQ